MSFPLLSKNWMMCTVHMVFLRESYHKEIEVLKQILLRNNRVKYIFDKFRSWKSERCMHANMCSVPTQAQANIHIHTHKYLKIWRLTMSLIYSRLVTYVSKCDMIQFFLWSCTCWVMDTDTDDLIYIDQLLMRGNSYCLPATHSCYHVNSAMGPSLSLAAKLLSHLHAPFSHLPKPDLAQL